MRGLGVLGLALVALVACTAPDRQEGEPRRSDTRQIPTNTEPGLHVSGHVNIGVVKSF